MAAIIGNIGPFDEKSEEFIDYADRSEAFTAHDIDNHKKMNVFLAVISANAYKLLKNLLDPENANTKMFTRLLQLLKGHFEPVPNVIAEIPTQVLDGVQRRKLDLECIRIRGETEEGGIDMQLRCFSVSSPKR